MSSGDSVPERRRLTPRQSAWALVAVIFALALVLSGMSMANYSEVAKAVVLTDFSTEASADLLYNASGALDTVRMTMAFTITNPSAKELKAWIITYKAWARDIPGETGENTSRLSVDGAIADGDAIQRYFPVYAAAFSFGNPEILIPPRSNITITKQLNMTRADHPDIMRGFESILGHAESNGLEVEWLHYTSSIMMITDIPPYSGPTHQANLVGRQEGWDITPGTGGAGT